VGAIRSTDILVTPLPRIQTAGGDVLHGMKQGDAGYAGFGEAYFSWVSSGEVKAWKCHTQMTMNIVVPVGQVRFVFRSVNEDGIEKFLVEDIGVSRYARITVPPGIWFGFQGLHTSESLVLNIASTPHDTNEVERLQLSDVDYIWS